MKKTENNQEKPRNLKRKLMSALTMLLIASILMGTASYAWLVMSTAPEVTGISTNIGANGSLEIALLNTETRQDMSLIKTTFGDSLANHSVTANNTWGNLVDLSIMDYGLNSIVLMPARLNAVAKTGEEGYVINSGILSVPTYGYDGRIVDLTDDTVSAIYNSSEFAYLLGAQDYGVRTIGTSDSLSVQASALAMAKSNITTYTNSAMSAAVASLNENGDALFSIMLAHMTSSTATFDDGDLDVLKSMIGRLDNSLNYIDLALRQGIVAAAASAISNEDTFTIVRDQVVDTGNGLSEILADLDEVGALPAEFSGWVTALENTQNDLNAAAISCDNLTGGVYSWSELSNAMKMLIDLNNIYINDTLFPNFDTSKANDLIGSTITLTLGPGSGVYASIADFTGNYSAIIEAMGSGAEITTMSTTDAYLPVLSLAIQGLEAADDGAEGEQEIVLTTTYGYALDMAFRCNANASELLLQTAPEQRVYTDSSSASTMGGGSYMEFTVREDGLSLAKTIELMDAVRVAFVDDQGTLLGVAKLNTSNRNTADGVVNAPLYLYEYSFSKEDGSMVMGERRKTDNTITSLEQSVAKAVSAIVWLDGDVVDNTMVLATEETSLNGVLNLQFSSSANLIPAANGDLLNITSDKSALAAAVLASTETYAAGQQTYTNVSWNAYAAAYDYAVAVNTDAAATESQIYNAAVNLTKAKAALENVSHETLASKIAEMRDMMGKTEDLARIVVEDNEKGYVAIDPYTQEQYNSNKGKIYRVDYANNLHDEGNGILTPIYSDESWTALAAALYDAEATDMNEYATDNQVDDAMTALELAYDSLERKVFYQPYEYNGSIYYFAISDETDTYGKWYDSDFKRIVADLTILKLDAQAEPVEIAILGLGSYVAYDADGISPNIELIDWIYPDLDKDEIIAAKWTAPEEFYVKMMTSYQVGQLTALVAEAEKLEVNTSAADALLADTTTVTNAEAQTVIDELQAAVDEAAAKKAEEEAAASVDMTSDQRVLLTAAVSAAKAVEGYNDTTKTELDALKTAVAAAEGLLSMETGATKTEADNALAAVNAQLKKLNVTEITEANSVPIKIPVGSELYEVVYTMEYPGLNLKRVDRTDILGAHTIKVLALTRSGVIISLEKEIFGYVPADGVQITSEDNSIAAGEFAAIGAKLIQKTNTGANADASFAYGETIMTYTWASSNTKVATVSGSTPETFQVNGIAAGTAEISLSVKTNQGNVYTEKITVTVTE